MPRTSKVAQHSRTPGAPPQKSLTIAVGSGLVDLNGYEGIDGAWAGVTIPCVLFVPGYHVQGIKDSQSLILWRETIKNDPKKKEYIQTSISQTQRPVYSVILLSHPAQQVIMSIVTGSIHDILTRRNPTLDVKTKKGNNTKDPGYENIDRGSLRPVSANLSPGDGRTSLI